MPAEQSFANLLRSSGFARFSRRIPQLYARPAAINGECHETFGMKRTFPNKYWGKRLQTVHVTNLDAEYGFAEFVDGEDAAHQYETWRELFYKMGTIKRDAAISQRIFARHEAPPIEAQTQNAAASLGNNVYAGAYRAAACKKIVGRLLKRVDGGFAVGVGGLVAFLPATEVPTGVRFSHADFAARRAHEFILKHAEMDASAAQPYIVLSLKAPMQPT